MTDHQDFARSFDALPAIVAFTAGVFARRGYAPELKWTVDFAVEELFTNMVKYSTMSTAAVRIELAGIEGGVEVTLTDYGVDPFDVTRSPDADTGAPIEARRPGGLGLHLVRRLVEGLDYEYSPERRESSIKFRVTGDGSKRSPRAVTTRGENARD